MNLPPLVGADVRRLTLSQPVLREKDQSLVTSAPTVDWAVSRPQCASADSRVFPLSAFRFPLFPLLVLVLVLVLVRWASLGTKGFVVPMRVQKLEALAAHEH